MIIALCNNIDELNNNRILDPVLANKFPGAQWVAHFIELISNEFIMVTGDVALDMINKGHSAKDILVIRELNAKHAKKLVKKGAIPFILTAFESPLVAWPFYDQIRKIAPYYKNKIFFKGVFETYESGESNNFCLKFPSYNKSDVCNPIEWEKRSDLVMVVSNKNWNERTHWKKGISLKYYIKCKGAEVIGKFSPTKNMALNAQLHDKRLEAIEYFGNRSNLKFDLYGKGWENTSNLMHDNNLITAIKKLQPQMCDDKVKTISRYKYAICFENMVFKGYVTEKIIDCFVAGVIPIYLGAPDIFNYVPKNSLIDLRAFSNFEDLNYYLEHISEQEAHEIIQSGQNFVNKVNGEENLFCYEDFAKFIAKLARGEKKLHEVSSRGY